MWYISTLIFNVSEVHSYDSTRRARQNAVNYSVLAVNLADKVHLLVRSRLSKRLVSINLHMSGVSEHEKRTLPVLSFSTKTQRQKSAGRGNEYLGKVRTDDETRLIVTGLDCRT